MLNASLHNPTLMSKLQQYHATPFHAPHLYGHNPIYYSRKATLSFQTP